MYSELYNTIAAIIAGLIGVPVVNLLKKKLGWENEAALLLTVGVSLILAALTLFITAGLTFASFTATNIQATLGTLFLTASLLYKLMTAPKKPPE